MTIVNFNGVDYFQCVPAPGPFFGPDEILETVEVDGKDVVICTPKP